MEKISHQQVLTQLCLQTRLVSNSQLLTVGLWELGVWSGMGPSPTLTNCKHRISQKTCCCFLLLQMPVVISSNGAVYYFREDNYLLHKSVHFMSAAKYWRLACYVSEFAYSSAQLKNQLNTLGVHVHYHSMYQISVKSSNNSLVKREKNVSEIGLGHILVDIINWQKCISWDFGFSSLTQLCSQDVTKL